MPKWVKRDFIDLAVRDPVNKGAYLLGIECDGAAYHSSRSARDRDRLRQAVLEDHRWYSSNLEHGLVSATDRELRRVLMAIEQAAELALKGPKSARVTGSGKLRHLASLRGRRRGPDQQPESVAAPLYFYNSVGHAAGQL